MDTASNNKNVIQVAIVDSNIQLRDSSVVKQLENSDFMVLFQSDSVQDALQKIKKNNDLPGVCIVEENFAAAKLLLKEYPDLRVLVLSTDDCEESVGAMLEIGVSGYVLKYADPDEIITALKVLCKDGKYFSTGIFELANQYPLIRN